MVSRQFVNSRLTIRVLLFFWTVWTVYIFQPTPYNDSFLFSTYCINRGEIEKTIFWKSSFCMLTDLERFNGILQYYQFFTATDSEDSCGIPMIC